MGKATFGICRCGSKAKRGRLDALIFGLVDAEAHALDAEAIAAKSGLLQGIDPRAKVVALFALIIAAVGTHSLIALAGLFLSSVALALASHIGIGRLVRQVWVGVLLFSGTIVLPALVLVPGTAIAHIPALGWTITQQGLTSAVFVVGRAETAATLALLVVLTTPWPHVLKALSSFGVPSAAVAILGMTHRYIFVFFETAAEMMQARRSRMLRTLDGRERRQMLMTTIGMLLTKTFALGADVHAAMIARGYRGEVRLIDDFRTRPRDWVLLGTALTVLVAILGFAA